MKNNDFSTTVLVDQKPEEVFNVILDVRAWWSGLFDESFAGSSNKLGDEFSFRAGGGVHYTKQKLVELIPNKKVVWLVTKSDLSFVDTTDEWTGTKISFEISRELDKTKVTFTHIGLVPKFECYESCAPAWTQYIHERFTAAVVKARG
ncbi:SRPBCC domain-containing protein [Paradesertivirga mongoliensis]|uniref:SRPBCC domain-containing protein n=1 Tax=Paradesertivirga mongoliensis TaxID=2100740 RepID=A0ABW4ZLS7_9SPHI|nr:SRPBCC domain-containing protein [Pedobacter mongoliensis]